MKGTVSNFVQKSYPYLIVLYESPRDRILWKRLLKRQQLLLAISELVLNLIRENISISLKDKKRLQKYKKELIHLVSKNSKKKYHVLTGQKGRGLLTTVLTLALPALSKLLLNDSRNRK